ncbi:type II toxin-antitoxin system RelE/ParE family toxin [Teichococcus vastitatis]|uniref:Type II toxin-antitoxin system RelE/ParE family toxin n=1 Tax=Teichococcus vastitatis TaxID=2307076 RepID=A0ABS9W811_9PROT|nr:type II toxin-antitoxin system RelE/ParE family toxin [Pseudoroseomonas vastitatis]MCI0755434.1 type II toxin-antitoxin system RelE/ParE family toxin [Pseudoroseomonas vastitatis]
MPEIRQTEEFRAWVTNLRDAVAKARIAVRIERVSRGLMGDIKPVGNGVSELRIDHGPGYRVYLTQQAQVLVILLCGGDKSTQAKDIILAKALARDLED